MSATPRLAFAGLESTGDADFKADAGSGSTPLNGALSIETVAAATPSPAIFWAISPPNEWPITTGAWSSSAIASR